MGLQFRALLFKASFLFLFVVATLVCPRALAAMEIPMFDEMATQDQRDYLKYLVTTAQKVLIEQNQPDQAAKLKELFHGTLPGDRRSAGEAEFEANLARLRSFAAEPNPFFKQKVEDALLMTLTKNGVTLTVKFTKTLAERIREKPFWPKLPLQALAR